MNERVFYIRIFGLMVIGGVARAAIRAITESISAPATVVVNNYNVPVEAEGTEPSAVEGDTTT